MEYDVLKQYYQERAKEQLREQGGEYLRRAVDDYHRYERRRRTVRGAVVSVAAVAAITAGAIALSRQEPPQPDLLAVTCNATCNAAEVTDNLNVLMS